jgi:hypothetical protein
VYVCWSRFVGASGRTKIFFSRSTDGARTFSPQISLSSGRDVQGCDITVEADGDVYVIWDTRDTPSGIDQEAVGIARSTDGVAPSRLLARSVRSIGTSRSTPTDATAVTAPRYARASSFSPGSRSSRG